MKALIVDDEAAAVIAVRLLVDWKKNEVDTVYEVNASQDVLPLIRSEEIQLIISDVRMPGMSGLELIREIQRVRPHTKIILMSGFGQFDYVQEALRQGVVDYILKPIDEKQINAAVAKAIQEWKRDTSIQTIEHSYREIDGQLKKKQAQRMLVVCLNSANQKVAFDQMREMLPSFRFMTHCRIASLYTQHLPEASLRDENDLSVLADLVNDLAYATGHGLAVMRRVNSNILILFDADMEGISDCARQILQILYQKTGLRMVMGLSDSMPVEEAFPLAASEARERARHTPLVFEGDGILQETEPEPEAEWELDAWEAELHKAALCHDGISLSRVAAACARDVAQMPVTIARLEKFRSSYLAMRLRWIEGFRMSQKSGEKIRTPPEFGFNLPVTENGDFSQSLLAEHLTRDLERLAEFFREVVGKGENENLIFQQIEQYLLMNYTEKLSLSSLAKRFAVSESYLSRAFKKNIGMGITEYVNRLRIQKAKEWLLNPELRIAWIAEQLGYSDEKYFSRVFRKLEGCSPQAYRAVL